MESSKSLTLRLDVEAVSRRASRATAKKSVSPGTSLNRINERRSEGYKWTFSSSIKNLLDPTRKARKLLESDLHAAQSDPLREKVVDHVKFVADKYEVGAMKTSLFRGSGARASKWMARVRRDLEPVNRTVIKTMEKGIGGLNRKKNGKDFVDPKAAKKIDALALKAWSKIVPAPADGSDKQAQIEAGKSAAKSFSAPAMASLLELATGVVQSKPFVSCTPLQQRKVLEDLVTHFLFEGTEAVIYGGASSERIKALDSIIEDKNIPKEERTQASQKKLKLIEQNNPFIAAKDKLRSLIKGDGSPESVRFQAFFEGLKERMLNEVDYQLPRTVDIGEDSVLYPKVKQAVQETIDSQGDLNKIALNESSKESYKGLQSFLEGRKRVGDNIPVPETLKLVTSGHLDNFVHKLGAAIFPLSKFEGAVTWDFDFDRESRRIQATYSLQRKQPDSEEKISAASLNGVISFAVDDSGEWRLEDPIIHSFGEPLSTGILDDLAVCLGNYKEVELSQRPLRSDDISGKKPVHLRPRQLLNKLTAVLQQGALKPALDCLAREVDAVKLHQLFTVAGEGNAQVEQETARLASEAMQAAFKLTGHAEDDASRAFKKMPLALKEAARSVRLILERQGKFANNPSEMKECIEKSAYTIIQTYAFPSAIMNAFKSRFPGEEDAAAAAAVGMRIADYFKTALQGAVASDATMRVTHAVDRRETKANDLVTAEEKAFGIALTKLFVDYALAEDEASVIPPAYLTQIDNDLSLVPTKSSGLAQA